MYKNIWFTTSKLSALVWSCWEVNTSSGFVRVLEILKALEFYSAFSRTGKSWKINASPWKSWKFILLKTIVCSITFGILFCKGSLLELLCIWETWKKLSESWKSPGELSLKKGKNPVLIFTQNSNSKISSVIKKDGISLSRAWDKEKNPMPRLPVHHSGALPTDTRSGQVHIYWVRCDTRPAYC